jgi:LCP family protein required for cell wall assembly
VAGDRNAEPAPWERAARQAGDDGWYGSPGSAGRSEYDYDDAPPRAVSEPRRARGGPAAPPPRSAAPAAPAWHDDDVAEVGEPVGRSRGGSGSGSGRGGRGSGSGSGSAARFGPKAIVMLSAASLIGTAAGTSAFAYQHFNSSINTADDGGIHNGDRPSESKANAQGQTPMNILLIGSDARDNGNNVYGGGETGQGARSDTTILLHVYADHQHAVGISIPRDLMVDIPSCLYDQSKPNGKKTGPQHAQFNAAFSIGNTAQGNVVCTRDTIEAMSGGKVNGIRIDHTVVVGFAAFAKLTDDIGGVDVCVPKDVPSSDGDNISLKKGTYAVRGQQALDYVRKREGLGDGSDISRTRRQQAFLGSMIKKIESNGVLNNPTTLSSILNDGIKYAQFDKDLGNLTALTDFASSMKGINPAHVQFMTLPGHYSGARVELDPASARAIWDRLRSDTLLDGTEAAGNAGDKTPATSSPSTPAAPTTTAPATSAIPPATISVRVLNGTAVTGLATDATASLSAAGYNAVVSRLNPGNIPVTTIVYATAKQEAAAKQLQLLYPGSKVEGGGHGTQLVVTLGADYAAAHPKAVQSGGTTPSGGDSSSSSPAAPLPTAISNNSRTADDNLCSGITQGFGAGTG